MATKRLPRPRDPAQLAKLIVDIATGEVEDRVQKTEHTAKTKPIKRVSRPSKKKHPSS
jgi:hypothetical protein